MNPKWIRIIQQAVWKHHWTQVRAKAEGIDYDFDADDEVIKTVTSLLEELINEIPDYYPGNHITDIRELKSHLMLKYL